jgi:hypothetical protein
VPDGFGVLGLPGTAVVNGRHGDQGGLTRSGSARCPADRNGEQVPSGSGLDPVAVLPAAAGEADIVQPDHLVGLVELVQQAGVRQVVRLVDSYGERHRMFPPLFGWPVMTREPG